MNLAVLGVAVGMSAIFGVVPYLILQLTVLMVGGSAGVWLFYVQHQFEDAYWERHERWDFTDAALSGSSYYRLPAVLRWFSGNIGYHHVHHLSSRIPNYNLRRCHESLLFLRDVKPMTLGSSVRSLRAHLWDERLRKLVSFVQVRKANRASKEDAKRDP
jgi:omega-6 fatty acid desaturase (delta-12 desaturase)